MESYSEIFAAPEVGSTTDTHLVPRTAGTASAAEDRTLNTWRIAFKPAY
jgi:hypothetical protein